MKYPVTALLLILICAVGHADETRYIRDSLTVLLRAAPQAEAEVVHRGLTSGTAVTLLGRQGAMAQVRTADGTEGWLASRYLLDEPIARDQLVEAKAEIERLRKLNDDSEAGRMLAALEAENSELKAQLAAAQAAVRDSADLEQSNIELNQRNATLQRETDAARTELARLEKNQEMEYFRNGAVAVGAGALLTLLVPLLRPRRKRSEWA